MNIDKVVVLGIDGLCFKTIKKMINLGSMNFFQKLLMNSIYGDLSSVPPFNSAAAWTSFATGSNPGNHGIYDFVIPFAFRDGFRIYSSDDIKCKTLWEIASINRKKSVVINVPMTYPPKKINGIMISGTLTPFINSKGVYPENILDEIKRLGSYSVDIDYLKYEKNEDKKILIKDLTKLTLDRANIAFHFYKKTEWDLFITVFTSSDRLLHYLFGYIDPEHPWFWEKEAIGYRDLIVKYFNVLDDCLKQFVEKRPDNTILFIISDHGFGPLNKIFFVTNWLINEGLLKLTVLGEKKDLINKECFYSQNLIPFLSVDGESVNLDWQNTIAYPSVASTLGIYINKECKKIRQANNPEIKYRKTRTKIIERLSKIVDLKSGQKIFESVLPKEEVYNGNYIDDAPDIFIKSSKMEYSITSKIKGNEYLITESLIRSGNHRENGLLVVNGNEIRNGRLENEVRIIDIAPTILEIFNIKNEINFEGLSIYNVISN